MKSGIYKHVVVLGGGAVAKLGMNCRDHIKKDVPVLEDVLGSFAVLILSLIHIFIFTKLVR